MHLLVRAIVFIRIVRIYYTGAVTGNTREWLLSLNINLCRLARI